MHSFIPSALLAFFAGLIPYFILKFLKKKRLLEFERQLPDALDLIARSFEGGTFFCGRTEDDGRRVSRSDKF